MKKYHETVTQDSSTSLDTHLFGGKHQEDFGSRMGVSGCPVCPSTVLMEGLG